MPAEEMSGWDPEPSSYRDPDSTVFYLGGRVCRGLTERGLDEWTALAASSFFSDFTAEGKIVATRQLELGPQGVQSVAPEYVALLEHEAVPFISYPYEWTFGMLKDAALLQLELLLAAVDGGLMLKDASPYNVQWHGSKPVFIDVGSFERLREGEAWSAYRQFCMLYLYPLMLQAYKGVEFQPWLRGRSDGIEPGECRRLMSMRDFLRRGVFSHVYLHSRFERRYADREEDVRSELVTAGFGHQLIRANATKLRKLIDRLRWQPHSSEWVDYRNQRGLEGRDGESKDSFVRSVASSRRWRLVWDLGCNDGHLSRIAAESARYVLAMDRDHAVVDALFHKLREEEGTSILPLCIDVADLSGGSGWRGQERSSLVARGRPDLVLVLALVHHLAISQNIPLRELVDWLASLGASVVVEFVTRDDPMARRLLARKRDGTHADYEHTVFERWLSAAFDVERRETLASGTRILYAAHPRS